MKYITVLKTRTICHALACENWSGLVNSYVYYAHHTHEIYQVLPYSMDLSAWILLIGPLETNFSEIVIKIHTFLFKKMLFKSHLQSGGQYISASIC